MGIEQCYYKLGLCYCKGWSTRSGSKRGLQSYTLAQMPDKQRAHCSVISANGDHYSMTPDTYRHKKTGTLYLAFNTPIEDCTNSRAGTQCILYSTLDASRVFVREIHEFKDKFQFVHAGTPTE